MMHGYLITIIGGFFMFYGTGAVCPVVGGLFCIGGLIVIMGTTGGRK